MLNLFQRVYRKFIYSKYSGLIIEKAELSTFIRKLIPYDIELVRIGSAMDGGYLLPEAPLSGITKVFSPGVGSSSDFEFHFAELGIPCYLADASVDGPAISHCNFHFSKKFIGSHQEDDRYLSLDNWVNQYANLPDEKLLLQMDIEGWEYNNLLFVSEQTLSKFEVLVVEFHRFNDLCLQSAFPFFKEFFNRLLEDFVPVHVHPNNQAGFVRCHDFQIPELLEITFLRKSRFTESINRRTFIHHALDQPNVSGDFQISLENWC